METIENNDDRSVSNKMDADSTNKRSLEVTEDEKSKCVDLISTEPETKKSKIEAECETISNKTKSSDGVVKDGGDTNAAKDSNDVETKPETTPDDTKKRLTELDVGMTEYMGSTAEPFTATIKQRYSDFVVNEIDSEGNVVHLTSMTYDEDKEDEGEEEEEKLGDGAEDVLSEVDREAIVKMVNDHDKALTHNILAPEDKALRTKIHMAVKKSFSQLETITGEDDEGNKVIKVTWRKGKRRDVERDEWPKSKKSCRYVRFVLYKECKDTMDAIGLIARNLKVRESMFQYAGTKDKRAKTTQEITAHRVHPKKLVGLNKILWNMGLGHFRYVQEPLRLGQLTGNHFTIVLRNVQASNEVVDTALTSLKEKGFINYFGMQRFGTTSIPTHQIGSALLQGEWQKAIDLILAPRNDVEIKDVFQRKWEETKDPAATLKLVPRFCGLERNLLEALARNTKPFNALEKLSRNTRLLYLHSYQSLVWNKMASRRLSELGHAVIEGDLVMDKTQNTADDDCEAEESCGKPVLVTKDNLSEYSLKDVVLPLPGHSVTYPHNSVGDWYRETLEADGLDIDKMKRPQRDYSLPGAYRHIAVIPKTVSWTHRLYNDYTVSLTLSDVEVINGETLQPSLDKGSMKAVVLELSLPSSCYATMALREVMRTDTSSFHQASTNVTS